MSTSPTVALCNHSCEPNAVVVFPFGAGKGMQVVAIRDLSPDEEVLTAYIDISVPKHIRQADLKDRYHFVCDCTLCQKTGVDPRWVVRHPGCSEEGVGSLPGKEVIDDPDDSHNKRQDSMRVRRGIRRCKEDQSSSRERLRASQAG
jgi:hypothetical protein